MILSLDLESIPLPPEARQHSKPTHDTVKFGNTKDPVKQEKMVEDAVAVWESGERAALDPAQGRIALVVIKDMDTQEVSVFDKDDERELLKDVFGLLEGVEIMLSRVIGHNINGFDMPYLYKRAWLNGIKPHNALYIDNQGYRPTCVRDTMRHWTGDRNEYIKLSLLCSYFGIEVKEGDIDGKDFYKFWAMPDRRQDCIDYCTQDVIATGEVATRMGII